MTGLKIKKNYTMDSTYMISKKGIESIESLDSLHERLRNLKNQLDRNKRELLDY